MPIARSHKNTGGFIGTAGTYYGGGVFSERMEVSLSYQDRWDVIRNGLVMHLDAKDSRSYSGTGTTWYDLSGNSSNAVWESTPTWNGSYFSNTNNISAPFTVNTSIPSILTVEMTMKINSMAGMPFGWQNYDVYSTGNQLGFNTGGGDVYGIPSSQVTSLNLTGGIAHYVFEMWTGITYQGNNKMYINSSLQSLSLLGGTEQAGNRVFNNGVGRISCWKADNNYRMDMNLYQFKVYNRQLLPSEVSYNYSVAKMKYGF